MYRAFISYSSADRGWAELLEEKLGVGLAFRDKTRLKAGQPYQEDLFRALDSSSALITIWSRRVRDMNGAWKEWVITERERFRVRHPEGPIIYVLLDDESPQVDAHVHRLDDLRAVSSPEEATQPLWSQLVQRIKTAMGIHTVEIPCCVLACTDSEFATLSNEPNLLSVLQTLNLNYQQVATWYGPARDDWRPAGRQDIRASLADLEQVITRVLKEEGVPDGIKDSQVTIRTGLNGLWDPLDQQAQLEIARVKTLDFCWVFIDPLSLYHPAIYRAAVRVANCREHNRWLNVFILDPIGWLHDRSRLRSKLESDLQSLYDPLVRPSFQGRASCLGGVDVWHSHDFERAFRETVRLRSDVLESGQTSYPATRRGLVTFGAGG